MKTIYAAGKTRSCVQRSFLASSRTKNAGIMNTACSLNARQAASDIIAPTPLSLSPRYSANMPKNAYMLSHCAQYAPFVTTVGRYRTARKTPSCFAFEPVYRDRSFMQPYASKTSNRTDSSFIRYSSEIPKYENAARKYIYGGL